VFLVRLFAATFLLVSLAIAPEPDELRERHREILSSKPIAARTLLAARCIHLLVLSALIVTAYGLVSFVAAAWHFGVPPRLAAAEYAMLVLGGFTTALLWLYTMLGALRFVRVETVRKAIHAALAVFTVGLALFSVGLAGGRAGIVFPARLGRALGALLGVLPSTWFARFWLPAPAGASVLERAGVVVLAGSALGLGLSGILDRRYVHLAEMSGRPAAGAVRAPMAAKLLAALLRLPLVAARLSAAPAIGVAIAILTLTQREEVSRLKVWLPRMLAAVFFVLGFHDGGALLALAMLSYFAFGGMVEGLDVVGQSAQADASWLFFAAPLSRRDVARGLMLAVTLRFLVFPLLLLSVLLFRTHEPLLAALLGLGTLFAARATTAVALALRPGLPLSREHRGAQTFVGFAAGFALSMAGAAAYAVATVLASALGLFGHALVAAGVAAVLAAEVAARVLASRRLEGLEYAS
jgi:hypothetical protein